MKVENKKLTKIEKFNVRAYLLEGTAIHVKEGVIKANKYGSAIENAKKWAKEHSQIIIRPDIGIVIFNENGVKNSLSHKFGQRKLDAIQAIPTCIKTGKIIDISDDLNGRPIKNIILTSAIKIGRNERSFLCVRLIKNIGDNNRLYIHEVFNVGDIKNRAIPFQTPGANNMVSPQRGIALYLNLLRDILFVN